VKKILTVAFNEYKNVVFTISFLIGLVAPVFLYGGFFALMFVIDGTADLQERRIAVVDYTGELIPALEEAARERNRSTDVYDDGEQKAPEFGVVVEDPAERTEREILLDLSERVRADDIFAFALIGPDYVSVEGGNGDYLRYYSESPTYRDMPNWLNRSLRDAVEQIRFTEAGLDEREVNQLVSHVSMNRFNLALLDEEGNMTSPKEENPIVTFFIAFAVVMMLFAGVMVVSQIFLNSVIEEKMQRIAEVLLASVSPFQLLAGKLLGGTMVGLTFSVVYLSSGVIALISFDNLGFLPPLVVPFFLIFLLLAMLTFGSLFGAVSSACQDLKDSQNLVGPIMMLLMIPMFFSIIIVDAPESNFAIISSLIPGFSPMTMMARIAIPPGPPLWQILTAVALNLALAIFTVWAASRIFRIGILSGGKAPSWKELVSWLFRA